MKKFYVAEGESKTGPYTIDELKAKLITRDTLVWTEGMSDWQRAGDVAELSELWTSSSTAPPPRPRQSSSAANPVSSTPPKSWMIESILVTVFCCLPFGIVGIVNASQVETRFSAGDVAGAERAAREAKKWTMIGFWIGVAFVGLYLVFVLFSIVFGIGSARFNPGF